MFKIFKDKSKKLENADKLPTYYEPFAKDILKTSDGYKFQLCADDGSENFEIWYYGNIMDKTLIISTEVSLSKVIAKALTTGQEIVVFDGLLHGYDNYAWQEHADIEKIARPLKKSDFGCGKVFIKTQSLPDTEDDWELDEDGYVIVDHNKKTQWIEFKRNAITDLEVYLETEHGKRTKIISEELA